MPRAARHQAFRDLFGVLDSDVPAMLRKNPGLLLLDGPELRARYENVAHVTRFNAVQVRCARARVCVCLCVCVCVCVCVWEVLCGRPGCLGS
jgi:hypothetical protein